MENTSGIWIRLVLDGNSVLTGFVPGAESPNDFWVTFKTQLVRMDQAVGQLPSGKKIAHETVYVNRDYVMLAAVVPSPK